MFTKLGVSVPTSHHILTRSQLVQCIVLSPALETDTKSFTTNLTIQTFLV